MRKIGFSKLDIINSEIKILFHSDSSLIGKKGKVIFEGEKTFILDTGAKKIIVYKASGIYELAFKRDRFTILGEALVGKPVKRVK
ncbi:ribonuclease P protein subunit [Metallosphaera tengchongensis]|uniref:Ribonuclease P protein component 1 n=1 Tax=Metallosphaera tengchongensis TaxID=1532350 RepID=A0A6N0NWA7_9CREN|nr:ribonuclease P protein subunit [Metallosphaera tengchongensis]QKQ99928.1 ribonuclease P protein subunit [Metallosphaera tengchongensis]